MLKTYIAMQLLLTVTVPAKIIELKDARERGSLTLEQAVVAGVLFVAAVALGAVIVVAVTANANKITGGN